MNPTTKKVFFWVSVVFLLWMVFSFVTNKKSPAFNETTYNQFVADVKAKKFVAAQIDGNIITVKDAKNVETKLAIPNDPWLVGELIKAEMTVKTLPPEAPSMFFNFLLGFGPVILLIGFMIYMARQQSGKSGGGAFTFGKSKAKKTTSEKNTVTFADVAGCDEAKEEVKELVDFLKDPQKFQKFGGQIPKGILLSGSPGTGKTLLARAIAGEAGVPFFTISGSDFVEMFVGVGASRVRDLFDQAKKSAPCIIFIDEIDAVGRARGNGGTGGGNDEREQTLNQMLVEMDGFESNSGVIVIAATNRPDILDSALLRPGRFDRQVSVGLPDIKGREQILWVHLKKIPLSKDVKASAIARGTVGFSGAELANLVNEAALFAAKGHSNVVSMADFERARDKIIMGPERKGRGMPEEERKNTAYHEAGHAIAAYLLPKCDPVHKVTIVPRGRALGLTMQLPTTDRYSTDKVRLENNIAVLFGGRVAEELFMNQATTGASNDYERATAIARNMVTKWGYSEVIGPMVIGAEVDSMSGAHFGKSSVSENTLMKVDAEIRRILNDQYKRVEILLIENSDKMHLMAKCLLDWETLDADQIKAIMENKPPTPPKEFVPPVDVVVA